jgi:hypothetical protein
MTQKTSSQSDDVFAAVDQFVRQALEDGCDPAELSAALTLVAVRMGLDLAPSAGAAFAVVMRAASDAAAQWASSQDPQDTGLDGTTMIRGRTVH